MLFENGSVTSLQHQILARLQLGPFEDLCAEDYEGNLELYSTDLFRRLYNDAVESMLYYRQLAEKYSDEADSFREQCEALEQRLLDLTEEGELPFLHA